MIFYIAAMVRLAALVLPDTLLSSLSPLLDAFELTRERSARTIASQIGDIPDIRLSLLSPDGQDMRVGDAGVLRMDRPISSDDFFDFVWIPAFRAHGEAELRQRLVESKQAIDWLKDVAGRGAVIGASGAAVILPMAAQLTKGLSVPVSAPLLPVVRALFPRFRHAPDLAVADHRSVVLSRGIGQDVQAITALFTRFFSPESGRWLRSVFGNDTMMDEKAPNAELRDPLADQARMILEQRFTNGVSIAQLADELCVSHGVLIRRFRNDVGVTHSRYVHQLRVNAAKRLLARTDRSIDSIATAVGYGDPRLFREMFRKATETTATDWRRAERDRGIELRRSRGRRPGG